MTANIESDLMEARAVARYVRVAPMKARRVVDLVRGRSAVEAVEMLRFVPQAAGVPVRKTIESAVANAEHNLDLDRNTLRICQAYVDEGPTLKRWRARAQGRPGRILKRTSHITVVVESAPEGADSGSARSGRGTKQNRRAR